MSSQRPILDSDERAARAGAEAVSAFVAELQGGLDRQDADLYDRRFAEDVIWGSPFGATVQGYEALHAIHAKFQSRGVARGSRFEVERILVPARDVVIAQIRRIAPGADDTPSSSGGVPNAEAFSETSLYVLVRKEGQWWLAAGQNTPIRAVKGA